MRDLGSTDRAASGVGRAAAGEDTLRPPGIRSFSLALVLILVTLGCRGPGSDHPAAAALRTNVILIVVDTLRADHLGTYGYGPRVSPRIDAFARRATVFETAVSQAPHTIPSMLQLMTSRYHQGKQIDAETPTVAEMLSSAGYRTAAVVENALFEFSPDAHGLMRGFETFYRNGLLAPDAVFEQHWKTSTPADVVTAQARRWLRSRAAGAPFFLWLHYFDPHDPYMPPYSDDLERLSRHSKSRMTGDIRATDLFPATGKKPPPVSDVDRDHLRELYDAEIRYLDQSLGELLDFLDQQGLLDKSLVILTADHGESLGEHDQWTHGTSLFEQQIHVPLIVKYPGQDSGRRIAEPVESLAIVPTILDVTGVRSAAHLDGRSLTASAAGLAFVFWKDEWVVRSAEWKLLNRGAALHLFHVSEDPGEEVDLADDRPRVVRRLLRARQERLTEIEASDFGLEGTAADALREMKSLGYLN